MNMMRWVVLNEEELQEAVEMLRLFGTDVSEIEAKRARDALPKGIRDTISAFSNTRGGTIILGLTESEGFAATGVSDPAKMTADLASCCAQEFEPPVRPLIQTHLFEGETLVTAEIPEIPQSDRPCFYIGAGIGKGSFVRVHDGDHRLSSYEVQMMLASRGQPREDEEPVPGTSIHDLDTDLVEQFVHRLREGRPFVFRDLSAAEALRQARILVTTPEGDNVTVAGIAALGRYPQHHFPQLMLTFVHYPTVDGADTRTGERFLDNVAIEGPIPVMVRDTLDVIRRNMSRRSVVSGVGRSDTWEYPETALREAIVNALVHRDLSSAARGTQVQVEMYPDRLAIRSPGGLFGPVSEDSLGEEGISSSRNAVLLKALEDVPLPGDSRTVCENRGSGIRAMIASLRDAGLTLPQFRDRISSFTVTFPNHALMSDDVVTWLRDLGEDGLSDSQCMALALMREGEAIDNLRYRNATRIDSRQATAELQDLVEREVAVQEGSRRWARYRLHARLLPGTHEAHARRRSPADRREELLHALGRDTMSRAELAARTGLSDQVVRRWLRILRQDGLVEITGSDRPQSKNTRYRVSAAIVQQQGQTQLDLNFD